MYAARNSIGQIEAYRKEKRNVLLESQVTGSLIDHFRNLNAVVSVILFQAPEDVTGSRRLTRGSKWDLSWTPARAPRLPEVTESHVINAGRCAVAADLLPNITSLTTLTP